MFPLFYNNTYNQPYELHPDKLVCGDLQIPVVDEIPRFVNSKTYASLFGDQWKQYKRTQLDSYTGVPISHNRLYRCLGPLKDNLNNKLVLEAGCGAGRFTEILLQQGAVLVSSDISAAVEVNKENFPLSDRHTIIQADINNMPYREESFDVVICLGVIQHTPSPEQTINNLYKLVKKGGSLIIDHYTFTRSNLLRLAPLYRIALKNRNSRETIAATTKLVKRYLPLHKRFAKNKWVSVILNRISPVISYYTAFPELTDELQSEWALLDTHDSLTDYYKHFRSKNSIKSTLEQLNAVNIHSEYGGNGVEARCVKPL